jgi:triacylglycerol lipase
MTTDELKFDQDFDAGTRGWNAKNALAMAYCSDLAYETRATVEKRLGDWNLHFVDFLSSGNTQGFLADGKDFAIVCYRGTEPNNAFDWATDAQARQVPGPFGMIHIGFRDALDLVWKSVNDFIQKSAAGGKRVFVAGHSLGGALACLTVARALEGEINGAKLSLHTIGQPRVGDTDFTAQVNQRMADGMVRIVNNIDLVPRVPPRRSVVGHYDHCAGVVWIDADGNLHRDPAYWETLLNLVEFTPQPDSRSTPEDATIHDLHDLLDKFAPGWSSPASLLKLGVSFLQSNVTRVVLRSIGKETMKDPISMISDHFRDHYTRRLDTLQEPVD